MFSLCGYYFRFLDLCISFGILTEVKKLVREVGVSMRWEIEGRGIRERKGNETGRVRWVECERAE